MKIDNNLKHAINNVIQNIRDAAVKSGRKPEDVLLLGVTKTVDVETMQKIYDLGVTHFGENRVQEYLKKSDIIRRECHWHIIGRLQTNKVRYLDQRITLIHSLDRIELAEAIQKRGQKINHIFPVLVQVNVSGEDTKAGIYPDDVMNFLTNVSKMGNIKVKGLMTMAPYTEDPEEVRYIFKKIKKLAVDIEREKVENISMEELSMGMSGDYKIAIEEGSTIVRVGSALFGERVY
ncbi:MAG TPA: YggS family pyridoxal phosphate-dependent enzyme [Clostridiaceae bacterium]|jgi:pyridoxal phosphate enzyme (YggS family)|nr:YggS family pyridoxal phosphate-dependent enzyme [Clostridiaceae bacterium]